MSINFSEVFASPRLPTPRPSGRAPPPGSRRDGGAATSSSDGCRASPVASALHTAERDINLDDDLNALLQLAGTTTPGGRTMTFMSPLLTSSLRRAASAQPGGDGVGGGEPPSSLQLPIISGSSMGEPGSSRRKMVRNGAGISPPHLSIRSRSAGSQEGHGSPLKPPPSSKKKSKKRKSPAAAGGPPDRHSQQQQHPGYAHANMSHYGHPHAANHGYYHHPGYHAAAAAGSHLHHMTYPSAPPHPAPQQHYAYSEQRQGTTPAAAAPSPIIEAPPPKSSRKKKDSRRSKSSSSSKSKAASKTPSKAPAAEGRPATPANSNKRVRKSSSKSASSAKKPKTAAAPDPAERERITAAIYAVNAVYGDGTEKDKKLAAATLRGVTMRPSGKWQAQLYYAGKSRYIGVFDSKEKASLAYEVAREVLKSEKDGDGPANAEETDRNVALARKAAFAGVTEHAGK